MNPGQHRLGGTALAQCFSQLGEQPPNLDLPENLVRAFKITQGLLKGEALGEVVHMVVGAHQLRTWVLLCSQCVLPSHTLPCTLPEVVKWNHLGPKITELFLLSSRWPPLLRP